MDPRSRSRRWPLLVTLAALGVAVLAQLDSLFGVLMRRGILR
jgi:hypothetical protein